MNEWLNDPVNRLWCLESTFWSLFQTSLVFSQWQQQLRFCWKLVKISFLLIKSTLHFAGTTFWKTVSGKSFQHFQPCGSMLRRTTGDEDSGWQHGLWVEALAPPLSPCLMKKKKVRPSIYFHSWKKGYYLYFLRGLLQGLKAETQVPAHPLTHRKYSVNGGSHSLHRHQECIFPSSQELLEALHFNLKNLRILALKCCLIKSLGKV